MWVIGLLLLITFEAIADIFSKEYSMRGTWQYWILAIVGYIIANAFWLFAIRRGSGLVRGAILFSVGSALVAILIGLIGYHEKISKIELVGIGMGIISIILIFWPDVQLFLKG